MKINHFFSLQNRVCFSMLLLLLSPQVQAQVIEIQRNSKPDGVLYFEHQVKKGETAFGLAKKYRIILEEFLTLNQSPLLPGLNEGGIAKIPFHTETLSLDSSKQAIPLYYRVMPKDNYYALAHRILKIPESQLTNLNPQFNSGLQAGALLKLGYLKLSEPVEELLTKEVPLPDPEPYFENPDYSVNSISKRGLAFVEMKGLGEGRYFALHATAPIESQILVTNPINNKAIPAKVIGRIPPIYEKSVMVVVSSSVAYALGIPDKRFYAQIIYQKNN
ncbi:MAG: LysM peptidoglycan-binding domain-containing protein [Saprospiraceae bacterium]|nr:LysM peptidoglycan-binding domain-containing protein [Saprospiraceae bacterium]